MTTIYGIRNCDTVRKARRWLEQHGVEHRFHDLRTDGLEPERLQRWLDTLGWEQLVNRRGTTWRKLSETQRADLDSAKAKSLLLANPTLVKRPVLEHGDRYHLGFTAATYAGIFFGGDTP